MNSLRLTAMAFVSFAGLLGSEANAVNIETVRVGNPGNAGDNERAWDGTSGHGSVSYEYNIGKYEVTAGQYTEFLNAVATTDTYELYNTNMDTLVHPYGCNIKRSGTPGNYAYSVDSDWTNRPVNLVSWGDAARFANWISNGQPTGVQDGHTTEDGSYSLNGATSERALEAVKRSVNATFVIPSDDEWYKSAYHQNDGVTSNYWDYPTGSDTSPSNVLGKPVDAGNNATYYDGTYTIGSPYWRTEVGDHENSGSPYGTFDQGGNVWEWTEGISFASSRIVRGGSFGRFSFGDTFRASNSSSFSPAFEDPMIGFRIAFIPEPTTLALLSLGSFAALRRRRS